MAKIQASIVLGILSALYCASVTSAVESFGLYNDTTFLPVNRNGKILLIREELAIKLEEEQAAWHWTPWIRTRIEVFDNVVREVDCLTRDTFHSFIDGIFTDEQLRQGAFLLYVLFGIYAFTLLAIVCNDYFIPCVELICEDLKIPQNVAAATFMAVATSCPEFFVNVISTFLTGSDMGIGTIVGSALFNALGVAAIGGIAAVAPIPIERRPVTRDVIIYMVNVSVLVLFVWDGQIDWYESLVLGILYILYFIVMFNSMRLFALYDKLYVACCKKTSFENTITDTRSVEEGIDNKGFAKDNGISNVNNDSEKAITEKPVAEKPVVEKEEKSEVENKPKKGIWIFPSHKSGLYKLWWLYVWPLKCILGITIPSPVTRRRFYPFAFIMCIVWIGANSYFVTWSMTVIGHTFFIPESVMGMTFLAFGGCVPEACSIFIMSRRGEGGIGVSNALGANSLAILFALGLPWLIKTVSLEVQGAENTAVLINSAGIDFVVGSLLCAVACLWITLFIGKFTLRRSVGFVLIFLYLIFITFAVLVEMGIILDRGIELYSTC